MPNSPISASGLNRNPQNIHIYSCGYDPTPSLTSNHFPIFEIASINPCKQASFSEDDRAIELDEKVGAKSFIANNPFKRREKNAKVTHHVQLERRFERRGFC
jgi:hypothetical protein